MFEISALYFSPFLICCGVSTYRFEKNASPEVILS